MYAQDTLKTRILEEVAITAVRASETAPISQRTVKRSTIEAIDLGQNTSLAIEKLTPSIISFSDAGTNFGNYNQLRLRGIDQTRINMTLNGAPINDMVDQGVFFSNFSDFTSSIQSFQVQRGVGISSNGTASYAGAINFESINLDQDQPSGSLNLTAGSFGSFRINGAVNTGKLSNDFAAYARVSRITSDGYKYHSGSNATSLFFSGAKFLDDGLLKITAFAGKTQNEQAYLPVLRSDIETDPRTNYFSRNDTDDFEQEMIQIQYVSQINTKLSWNSMAYYGGSRGFFPFYDSFFNSQTIYALSNNHYGFLSNFDYIGQGFRLSGGIHGYLFDRNNETAISPEVSIPFYQDQTQKNEFSAFAKVEYDLGRLTVFGDLQLRNVQMNFIADTLVALTGNDEAQRQELFFNPKFGATYSLSAKSNVYASFGRTGREPTRTDLLQGDFNSAISEFNFLAFTNEEVIQSEFVNDIEAGYRFFSKNLWFSVNGFWMSFENEISIVGGLAQNSYVPLRQNVESSSRSGVEVEFDVDLQNNLRFGLLSTFMSTNVDQFDTGTDVLTNVEHAFAPDLMIAPSIFWKPVNQLTIGLDGRYVSESFMELGNNPDFIIPSYTVVNSSITWNATESIELGFWINNIFDELYFTDGAPVDLDFDGTPEGPGFRIQPPRNYFFNLNVNF
jgi:iron complex outermembrane receptor protein